MYLYLEEIPHKHVTKNSLLKNVIGKIKNIQKDTTETYLKLRDIYSVSLIYGGKKK